MLEIYLNCYIVVRQYQCLYWHILASAQLLKTIMYALACIGACIGLYLAMYWSVLVLALVCIWQCIGLYWSVLGSCWWMYWRPFWHIEKIGMYLVYVPMSLCIIILYIPNTNAIHANTCWFVLVYIVIHTNMFLLIGHKLWYVLWYVLICICTAAHIINQYACNTNEIHINT